MGVRPAAAPAAGPGPLGTAFDASFLPEYQQPSGRAPAAPAFVPVPPMRKGAPTFAIEQPQLAWSRSLDRKVLSWCTERLPPAGSESEKPSTPPPPVTTATACLTERPTSVGSSGGAGRAPRRPTTAPGSARRVEPATTDSRPATLRVTEPEANAVTAPAAPAACCAEPSCVVTPCSARVLVDQLLMDIYKQASGATRRLSSATLTSSARDSTSSDDGGALPPLRQRGLPELRQLAAQLRGRVAAAGSRLGKHLRRRDQLRWRLERQQHVISAHLNAVNAVSVPRLEGGLRFSVSPAPGDSGFTQWLTAMQMVARLQGGIPPEFRRTLWLTLADKHLQRRGVDWPQAERLCFSEWSNPDDDELGVQIVKDLHRTGCSMFCGQSNQAVLKRVLLAYARWNKAVGYCQGFNMLAALILQVMDRNEPDSVKVMIYLIEGVLPESYFANNLRGLSVDMAVFRDLLRLRLPQLSRHLEHLQMDAGDNTGTSYEPPLTNVFTMQWFLTLFCNCLPQPTVLRVWDLIFLEGNQILLRTALAIWDHLADRIMAVSSADEFYSIMGVLTREILEFGHVDSNRLMKTVVAMQCPELPALRDKYMYNITPWTSTVSSGLRRGLRLFYNEDDSGDSGDNSDQDDDERIAVAAAFGIADLFRSPRRRGSVNAAGSGSGLRGVGAGPSAGAGPLAGPLAAPDRERERLSLDVSMLKQQYCRLRERQRQAHIIVTAACGGLGGLGAGLGGGGPLNAPSVAMNHLLLGKPALRSAKGRRLPPPPGAVPKAVPKAPAAGPSATAAKRNSQPCIPTRPVETLHWRDEDKRRKSVADAAGTTSAAVLAEGETPEPRPRPSRPRTRSGSASGSASSRGSSSSSTSTELCDDPGQPSEEEEHGDLLQWDDKPPPAKAKDPEDPKDSELLLDQVKQEPTTATPQPDRPHDADLFSIDEEPTTEAAKPETPVVDLSELRRDLELLEEDAKAMAAEAASRQHEDPDLLEWDAAPEPEEKGADTSPMIDLDVELKAPDLLSLLVEERAAVEDPSSKDDDEIIEQLVRFRREEEAAGQRPQPDDHQRRRQESPDKVVASVTEKLRLIMEHLSRTPSEDSSATARESSPTSTSSRESRQRLMDRLFGREGSLVEESDDMSAASLKSSALELDLSELLDESVEDLVTSERARSAAGDVEGVTASSRRLSRLDRQNSARIIRENSEILQRMAAWHRGGRSLTMPERSEPPCATSEPPRPRAPTALMVAFEVEEDAQPPPQSQPQSQPQPSPQPQPQPSPQPQPQPSPQPQPQPAPGSLSKQVSLDETKRPAGKLQLKLDGAAPAPHKVSAKPRYKFPEMSPVNMSPLQPLPSTHVLRMEGKPPNSPKKWRPELTPPSTPMVEAALARSATAAASAAESATPVPPSYLPLRGSSGDAVNPTATVSAKSPTAATTDRQRPPAKSPTPGAPRARTRPVVGSVTLDAPTTLPVQTPSLPRQLPAAVHTSSPSPPSPPGKPTGRRRKTPSDQSPDGAADSKSPVSFNPFPSRGNVRQPKEIGVKLGLYPSAAPAQATPLTNSTPSSTSASKPDRL